MDYQEYAQQAVHELQESQNRFHEVHNLDQYDNWFYDDASQVLRLYGADKEVLFNYIPVGTFSLKTNTWMWSWANESTWASGKFHLLQIRDFGEKWKYDNLANGHFDGDVYTGWELTAVAFKLLGGIGSYRAVAGDLEIYFLVIEQLTREEVDVIEAELIHCGVHGKGRLAYICQHLNVDGKNGFEEAFDTYPAMPLGENDDLQAWCSECEKERLRTDGWNDESMEFAKIKLVCEKCYFSIKDFNLS